MTDTRLPEQWLGDPVLDGLTSDVWRVHLQATVWSVKYGKDGLVLRVALRQTHPDGVRTDCVDELIACGLWRRDGDDFVLNDFFPSQSTAQYVEEQREKNRVKQAGYRAREKAAKEPVGTQAPMPVTGYVAGDVPGDVTRNVSGRVGQARTGQALETQPTALRDGASTKESPFALPVANPTAVPSATTARRPDREPTVMSLVPDLKPTPNDPWAEMHWCRECDGPLDRVLWDDGVHPNCDAA